MKEAAKEVVLRARRHRTPIIIWRDDRIVEVDPFSDELLAEYPIDMRPLNEPPKRENQE